jgi:hypothetical protein
MVKTRWTENDNEVVCKNYLAGIDYKITAETLPHLKINSVKLKYQNCLYLKSGNVKGSLNHASKIHIKIWNKLLSNNSANQK